MPIPVAFFIGDCSSKYLQCNMQHGISEVGHKMSIFLHNASVFPRYLRIFLVILQSEKQMCSLH